MKHRVFVIYDDKAKAYLSPFFLPQVGMAVRTFSDLVNDPGHNFGRHPGDYSLFLVGEFEDTSGQWTLEPTFSLLCVGSELKDLPSDSRDNPPVRLVK